MSDNIVKQKFRYRKKFADVAARRSLSLRNHQVYFFCIMESSLASFSAMLSLESTAIVWFRQRRSFLLSTAMSTTQKITNLNIWSDSDWKIATLNRNVFFYFLRILSFCFYIFLEEGKILLRMNEIHARVTNKYHVLIYCFILRVKR